jgi:hypothetical protein
MVDIAKDLKNYGISTEDGYLAWMSTVPVTLTVDTYGDSQYTLIDPTLVVSDFVFQTDVTWKSTGGLAGCGYMFRGDRNMRLGAFYEFYTIRLSGLPIWFAGFWDESYLKKRLSPDYATSAAIRQKNGSTNTYALVAQGDVFTFYTNADRMRTVQDDHQSEGRFAYQVLQESGETTCVFKNTWVCALK